MEKRREVFSKTMADLLEIPKDLILDLPRVTVIGRNEIHIENHRGIIEYNLQRVRINLSRGFLEINGQDLEIMVLMSDEISLKGQIDIVKYLD